MKELLLVTPAAGDVVTVDDMFTMLGLGPYSDDSIANTVRAQMQGYITAAEEDCRNYCRRAFLTQTWMLKLDSWPRAPYEYSWNGFHEIDLPKLPFQSIVSVEYVDVQGIVQTLDLDTSYGNNITDRQYGYQLVVPGEDQAARLAPTWARPWPPTRNVPSSVMIKFKCGYGGPVTVSMTQGSAVLSGPTFNPGDVGQLVWVPGAGSNQSSLETSIASVDGSGVATLADPAANAVSKVAAWVGRQVPSPIVIAIKLFVQFLYEQGAIVDQPMPRVVRSLLDPYRNLGA